MTVFAYHYELATTINSKGQNDGWVQRLSYTKPCVPPDSIRNLVLLSDDLHNRWQPMRDIDKADSTFIWARPNGRGGWGVGIGYRTVSDTYRTETSQPLPKDVVCWKNIGLSPS